MPFKSEKQRRFLWLKHPDIAKRWAHEYPNQKDLPMRVSDKKDEEPSTSKEAAIQLLRSALINKQEINKSVSLLPLCTEYLKRANSKLEEVVIPQDEKPTYAGEKQIARVAKPETEDEGSIGQERSMEAKPNPTNTAENPLLSKLAVVLAPKIQQELENRRAEQEARNAQRIPNNANVKQYPIANNMIPPPMGMAQAPQQAQPQAPQQAQQPAQPQNGQLASVGGGNSPNANPINSFGGLSSTGDINGNAAFGTQNQIGGEKQSEHVFDTPEQLNLVGRFDTPAKIKKLHEKLRKYYKAKGFTDFKPDPDVNLAHMLLMRKDGDKYEFDPYVDNAPFKTSAAIGLWDRIRAKRKRGEKPAKPGDKDYPDSKSWNKVTAISEKKAYGGGDDGWEYDRWLAGGFPSALNGDKEKIVAMTREFADAAKRHGGNVKFYSDRYPDEQTMYSPEEAIKRIVAAQKLDAEHADSLPNYYFMEHPKPRKTLMEMLHLAEPKYQQFPEHEHPLAVVHNKYFK